MVGTELTDKPSRLILGRGANVNEGKSMVLEGRSLALAMGTGELVLALVLLLSWPLLLFFEAATSCALRFSSLSKAMKSSVAILEFQSIAL